ncbi:MAG: 3-keto-5-aminohexanoate cleavage protein [Alphaproteobacteria bacterium]
MAQEVVVTCAVTGAHSNFQKHPNFPITPKQIADACIEARKAGAAVTHIHVRDPKTGMRIYDPALFREVVHRIRDSGSDVIINLTTGEGGRFAPSEENPRVGGPGTTLMKPLDRLVHIEELRPDIATLDCGTMNFGETVFMNTPEHLRIMAKRIKELGVKPEIECFEMGHILLAKDLIARGLIEDPPLFQLCLGIQWSAPATPEVMQTMRNLLPANAKWAAFGISRWEFNMVAAAVNLGGQVRVGLEDNLYLEKGVFGTNGQLVEKAVRIVRELGAEPVEPKRAAEILELPPRGQSAPKN